MRNFSEVMEIEFFNHVKMLGSYCLETRLGVSMKLSREILCRFCLNFSTSTDTFLRHCFCILENHGKISKTSDFVCKKEDIGL